MSYDLVVFDAAAAPSGRSAFVAWYGKQIEWTETHGYNDPDVPSSALRAWLGEITRTFCPMNGPHGVGNHDVDDPKVTDYCLGEFLIYAAFAWSQAASARRHTVPLAAEHGVG